MKKDNFEKALSIRKSIGILKDRIENLNAQLNALNKHKESFLYIEARCSRDRVTSMFEKSLFKGLIYSQIKGFEIQVDELEKEFENL